MDTKFVPEDSLLAVFHRVGDMWFRNDQQLIDIFAEASNEYPVLFPGLGKHPHYNDSKLPEYLVIFNTGCAIQSILGTIQIRPAPGLVGEYGQGKYLAFDEAERDAIDRVTEKIKAAYAAK